MTQLDATVREDVQSLYESIPYPPPVRDIDAFRDHRQTFDGSPRYYGRVFWPSGPVPEAPRVLVAGCGTSQAAKVAVQQPRSPVTAIDLSATSLDHTRRLKDAYELDNLELHQLPIERVAELDETFDFIVCTGVLHHLPDPDAGLRALRSVLARDGAMHIMVYATYGRAGVAMMQEYCRLLGVATDDASLAEMLELVGDLPTDHPLGMLKRHGLDLTHPTGLADALLHPQEHTYTVPRLHAWLERCGVSFQRWFLQAPYLAHCGLPASCPHARRLQALPPRGQHAAVELLRGTMTTHTFAAVRDDHPAPPRVDFTIDAWRDIVPAPMNGRVVDQEGLPEGVYAILRHPGHSTDDLLLPLNAPQFMLYARMDGARTIGEIAAAAEINGDPDEIAAYARAFFEALWWYDQVVVEVPGGRHEAS